MTRGNGKKRSKPFVKSADTNVAVDKSREDIRALLRRHGAAGFGINEDYRSGRVIISFVMPNERGGHTPMQIPIDVNRVHAAMYPGKFDPFANDEAMQERRREQSERTAWRQLHLIIDAALTAHSLGVMPISESFMAHTMVVSDTDGRSERMADYLERTQGALTPGVRALVPSST